MGANESNSESTPEQSDGNYRDADGGIEESEYILERVREEQRRFETRINSLAESITEYKQILNDIRELRAKRAEERSIAVKVQLERPVNSHEELDYGYSGVEEEPPETHHDRKRGLSL
ncbi:hypothetical protein VB735_32560 [Halotia wernerae UHCC 0503]|nr:hypothetical protein [Halotia wernerae UHCC 0503]